MGHPLRVESALTSRIKTARRVLGDDGREQSVIRTVHGRGYRFVAPVVMEDRDAADGAVAIRRADVLPQSESSGTVLLEREGALAVLDEAVADARAGRGRVVLVTGEAGMGKTTLVRAMASARGRGHVLVGACDDLVTPLPLGPLRDVAAQVDPSFAQALDSVAGRAQRAVLDELSRPPSPTVLVVEDAHWADEATIDALVFVTRRLADAPAAIVLTYRA